MPDPSDSLPARPRVLYQLASPLHLTRGPEVVARRQRMMQAWADHLDSLARSGEKGTPLRQKSAVTA